MNDILSFANLRQPRWQSFLVCSLVEEICESLAARFDAQCVDLDIDVPPNTVLTADRDLIRGAVLELVQHSLGTMPHGGDLVITSYDGPRGFELEVADSGPGLTSEAKKSLFTSHDANQSDDEFDLSAVFRIAEAHGGMITAANCPEGGTAFTLRIPRRRGAMGAAA